MRKIFLSALAIVMMSTTASADKPEHTNKGKKEKQHKKAKHKKHKRFSKADNSKIVDYYNNLPRGLQKKLKRQGRLPNGWQERVSVGKPMPKEYLDYAQPVPEELSTQISAGPIGSQLLQLSDRVIRIEAGTNMVLDAIRF